MKLFQHSNPQNTLENFIPIAKVTDLANGEMKQVTAAGTEILLTRVEDQFYAVGAHCTHYGAPLAKGALCGKHVICPWHHAWFDVTNGDLLEPPALDALPHYEVRIAGEEVTVKVPEQSSDRRLPHMENCQATTDKRVFAILGGGAAGYTAAQTLREDGFCGRILMITHEQQLPYDRTKLSKDFLQGKTAPEKLPLRPDDFFEAHRIEVLTRKEVKNVNPDARKILFADGETLSYDALLVATGGTPRKLEVPNADLKNIFALRSLEQANRIVAAVEGAKKAVVVGTGFIGMEAAASLQSQGLEVQVVSSEAVPFGKILGPELGLFFQRLHEKKGIRFWLGTGVASFEGTEQVKTVILESGERLEADLVIAGIGVSPETGFLSGIKLQKDGGVTVDTYLRIAPDLYAAGDIAHVPDAHTNELARIEHWRYAQQQGRTAAHNMAGKKVPFTAVPFFWTAQFGVSLRYLGHARGWDEILYDGSPEEPPFLACYIKDDRVTAIAGIKRDAEMARLEQLLQDNQIPSASVLKEKGLKTAFSLE